MSFPQDLLLLTVGWAHILLAPYTKVEESFNLHATHDVLMYGVSPSTLHKYDHFIFPGAVPRTFIGSVILAYLSKPVAHLAMQLGFATTKFHIQIIVRLVLSTINGFGLILLRRAVSNRFGRSTSLFYTLITISQFHLMFWMGRTLPNMFALLPVNISSALLLTSTPQAQRPSKSAALLAISLLVFAAIVFRAELALLLGPLTLFLLLMGCVSWADVIRVGLKAALSSIACTTIIDSYFWTKWDPPLWPELSSVWFNVYEGKSVEWGVSPYHTYFLSSLPKLLLTGFPLAIASLVFPLPGSGSKNRVRTFALPSIFFVLLISFLGHKEWRFIIYVVPVFNVAAARSLMWMTTRRKSTIIGRCLFLLAFLCLLCNLSVTVLMTAASMRNYPGGEAMAFLNSRLAPASTTQSRRGSSPQVHICNLAAQTGASLFTQTLAPPYSRNGSSPVIYDKTESLMPSELLSSSSGRSYTHLIIEIPPHSFGRGKWKDEWKVVGEVSGFERWAVNWKFISDMKGIWKQGSRQGLLRLTGVMKMQTREKLWILERVTEVRQHRTT